jgi:hypothetical protein
MNLIEISDIDGGKKIVVRKKVAPIAVPFAVVFYYGFLNIWPSYYVDFFGLR